MKNEIIVSFCIWNFDDLTHDQISKSLGIMPDKIYVKGQKRNPNNPTGTAEVKQNGWIVGSSLDKYSSFEDQMNSLLDIIEPKIGLFKPICEKYACEFSCAMFVYVGNDESTPAMHLDSRYNKVIKELKVEFDLDLYCFANEESM
jgi:hypothetical protein